MMEINFRQLLFQVGEREHKMNKKNFNLKHHKIRHALGGKSALKELCLSPCVAMN